MQGSITTAVVQRVFLSAALLRSAVAAVEGGEIHRPGVQQIGAHKPIVISSTANSDIAPVTSRIGDKISNTYSFYHPGASYISLHFKHMDLGEGCSIAVREASKFDMSYELTGKGRHNLGTFWARHIYGDSIDIELTCENWQTKAEFEVDEFVAGFPEVDLHDFGGRKRNLRGNDGASVDPAFPSPLLGGDARELSICGVSDMRNAQCYQSSHATEYDKAGAVAKVIIRGSGVCTGWLVGPNNMFITNEHCIQNAEQALDADYIFDYEVEGGGDCNRANRRERSTSEVTYEASDFVGVSWKDDWALIKLSGNPVSKHGYLEVDARKPNLGEKIYIPQHASGHDKEIAIFDTHLGQNERCEIQTIRGQSCYGRFNTGYWDLSYSCDTKGGSSGSPVISAVSHKVLGLHHCGGNCRIGNVAVPFYEIYDDMKDLLDPETVVTPQPSPPPTAERTMEPTFLPTAKPTFKPTAKPTFKPTAKPTASPTLHPTAEPTLTPFSHSTSKPTPLPSVEASPAPTVVPMQSKPCPEGQHRLRLDLQTDNNGHETFWILKDGQSRIFLRAGPYAYEDNTFYQLNVCVPRDRYKFTIRDTAKNGIAGEHGDGYFRVFVDETVVASGGYFGLKDQFKFQTW